MTTPEEVRAEIAGRLGLDPEDLRYPDGGYEAAKERHEAMAQELARTMRLVMGPPHGRYDGKPCRESYGWCFQHMAKAVPERIVGASYGPYDVVTPGDGPFR